jgi:hypothetical protein
MSAVLALLAAATTDEGLSVYKCRNSKNDQVFTLSYENRGQHIHDLELHVEGTPRLADDLDTKWRGKIERGGVRWQYSNIRNHSGTMGNMFLSWETEDEQKARLTWSSVSGGGHLFLEEQEQAAECTMFVPESSESK